MLDTRGDIISIPMRYAFLILLGIIISEFTDFAQFLLGKKINQA